MTDPLSSAARAWVDVDLAALAANARTVAARAERPLLPMVKANGYGLGAVAVARALDVVAPWGFGVATVEEGIELRAAGISRPVVVFTPLLDAAIPPMLAHDLRPAIGDLGALQAWLSAAPGRPFHFEIDTGMARAGVRWCDAAGLAAAGTALAAAASWEGVFTHFHSADADADATATQWRRLQEVLEGFPRRPALVHAANSAAALQGTRYAADLVRPGIHLYGGDAGARAPEPAPVARLQARVVAVRSIAAGEPVGYGAAWRAPADTRIATLGIGYADGVHRALGGRALVELEHGLAPVVGRVTMDMTMIDVGTMPVRPGDVAVIFGGRISVSEQARRGGTISYELLTAMGTRVPRRYGRAG